MVRFILTTSLVILSAAAMADDVAVTVYNSNLGVVSETRSLEFQKGVNRFAFTDVPSQIDPASVQFEVVGSNANISILEQNYAFDLVDPQQMYNKYIDQQIELIDKDGKLYSGTLLAFSGDAITLQEKSGRIKIVMMEHITEVNFPSLPEGLITRPTLFWIYNSDFSGKLDGKIGYQTSGMNWSAEYVGVLGSDEKNLDLSGWASIDNTSGKTFKEATLKLIAGDIGRIEPEIFIRGGRGKAVYTADMGAAGFEEKAFFEYHLYTLPRKATIADKETKQISLFEPAGTSVEKVFIYRPERDAKKVEVDIKFTNSKETGLGMPLPAGRVRMFKADDDGSMILLGEDMIDHTPKNEEVKVRVGYAFDIVAEQRVIDQTRISSEVQDQMFEIELKNRKDEPVTVEVEKKIYGYWDVLESSMEYQKKDAYTLVFRVPVGADKSTVLKFKIRSYLR
ncbi:MAG: DUF4139 domain-containing protein [Candidatus Zixiibacteriota bacterium]